MVEKFKNINKEQMEDILDYIIKQNREVCGYFYTKEYPNDIRESEFFPCNLCPFASYNNVDGNFCSTNDANLPSDIITPKETAKYIKELLNEFNKIRISKLDV